ncbi:class II histocompatibility antigen, B-L beta chain-like, partial [Manacus vitellinus]|uniref:class II histocompatibility antigen, B-L beta chain-like n=1 Tax=Manacus vitellinus TaxID=328815 RepID=UPI00115D4F1A
VFQLMTKSECYFINGTERVRLVKRYIYNREQYARLEIDLGTYVEDTLFGEKVAREWNHLPEWRELKWSEMERFCRHNYELSTPFLVNRREMPPDTVRSKILVGVGGFVLGLVFLALGLGFYLREKSS